MPGGITSVPLPAYWSSEDPEQWRRHPLKSLACTNTRCAANNANYATVFNESASKRPRRPYKTSWRSVSASSNPSTPLESEKNSKSEYVAKCGDCEAPLVPSAPQASSSTTLTPPTPRQVRTVAPGSYVARLHRSHALSSCPPPGAREPPPYFHRRTTKKKKPSLSAPPPSECDEYSSEEPEPSPPKVVHLSKEVGREHVEDPTPKSPSPFDQTSTGATSREPATPVSLRPPSESKCLEEVGDGVPAFTVNVIDIASEVERTESEGQKPMQEDNILLSAYKGTDYVESESSASPAPSEKGLSLCHDVRPLCDRNRISSFYNVLYTPDANTDDEEVSVESWRGGVAHHDLKRNLALEIAVLSALTTILILSFFPSFFSGVRNHILGGCSCTCHAAASACPPKIQSFQWFERWMYRGAHSLFGCRSPRRAVGSTVLR